MDLDLGLALHSISGCVKSLTLDLSANPRKRAFAAAFKDDDGDDQPDGNASSSDAEGRRAGEIIIVGWPPIKSTRRLPLLQGAGRCCGAASRSSNKRVKVSMEGAAMEREVDLSLHHSYRSLLHALNRMFRVRTGAGEKLEWGKDGEAAKRWSSRHAVTYQDVDGDWMLVGDVPWESFIQSANRLKIVNITDAK